MRKRKQKPVRTIWEVRFNKTLNKWGIFLIIRDEDYLVEYHKTKSEAVRYGAGLPRDEWKAHETLGQLRVFNKNGRIAFERTYPRSSDPSWRKG